MTEEEIDRLVEKQTIICLEEYVIANPYPDFETMEERLRPHMNLWAEYSEANHRYCKYIYENPTDRDFIVKVGKIIYRNGGITALVACHDVLKWFSPYRTSEIGCVRGQGRSVEIHFESVTKEWRA